MLIIKFEAEIMIKIYDLGVIQYVGLCVSHPHRKFYEVVILNKKVLAPFVEKLKLSSRYQKFQTRKLTKGCSHVATNSTDIL